MGRIGMSCGKFFYCCHCIFLELVFEHKMIFIEIMQGCSCAGLTELFRCQKLVQNNHGCDSLKGRERIFGKLPG